MSSTAKQLLDAAEQQFLTVGYDSVTMESLARAVGLSRATVYHYFSGKDALFAAVQERLREPVRVLMAKAAAHPDPLTGLQNFLFDYLHFWATHPRESELHLLALSKTVADRSAWPETNAIMAGLTDWFDSMLFRAVRAGCLRPHRTAPRAVALYCALEGALPAATTTKLFTPRKLATQIATAILSPLKP